MARNFRFSLSSIFIATLVCAIYFSKNLSPLTVVLLLEPVVIVCLVTVLYRGIPKGILFASNNNCYRLDGSKSERREMIEDHAIRCVRTDLYFIFYAVTILGNLLVAAAMGVVQNLDADTIPMRYLFGGLVVWTLLSCVVIGFAYRSVLKSLHSGIQSRSKQYLATDIEQTRRGFELDVPDDSNELHDEQTTAPR